MSQVYKDHLRGNICVNEGKRLLRRVRITSRGRLTTGVGTVGSFSRDRGGVPIHVVLIPSTTGILGRSLPTLTGPRSRARVFDVIQGSLKSDIR